MMNAMVWKRRPRTLCCIMYTRCLPHRLPAKNHSQRLLLRNISSNLPPSNLLISISKLPLPHHKSLLLELLHRIHLHKPMPIRSHVRNDCVTK